jgi:transposase InsO family protein
VFMRQVVRSLTTDEGFLVTHRVLIGDRDGKWSPAVRERLGDAGIRVVQTPARAPNANAHAERFVRSIRAECLDRMPWTGLLGLTGLHYFNLAPVRRRVGSQPRIASSTAPRKHAGLKPLQEASPPGREFHQASPEVPPPPPAATGVHL